MFECFDLHIEFFSCNRCFFFHESNLLHHVGFIHLKLNDGFPFFFFVETRFSHVDYKIYIENKVIIVGHLVSIYFGFLFLQQFLNNLLLCLIFFLKTILTFQSDNVVINVFTFYQWSIETLSIIINTWHVKNNFLNYFIFSITSLWLWITTTV